MGSAIISDCGQYRYRLERDGLSGAGAVAWIMVNPSTADATENDQTIRKVIGFSERLGAGWLIVGNIFAYRATDVSELVAVRDPVGPDNLDHLWRIMADASRVVFAWGRLSKLPSTLRRQWYKADRIARELGHEPLCLGVGKDGHPTHPQMIGYATPIVPWAVPNG